VRICGGRRVQIPPATRRTSHEMELAGLEPATSWVQSRRALRSNAACLQGNRAATCGDSVPSCRRITRRFRSIWAQIRVSVPRRSSVGDADCVAVRKRWRPGGALLSVGSLRRVFAAQEVAERRGGVGVDALAHAMVVVALQQPVDTLLGGIGVAALDPDGELCDLKPLATEIGGDAEGELIRAWRVEVRVSKNPASTARRRTRSASEPGDEIIIGDKGFAGCEFEQIVSSLDASLVRPDQKDEQPRLGKLGHVRQWIESMINTTKSHLSLELFGGQVREGVWARVCNAYSLSPPTSGTGGSSGKPNSSTHPADTSSTTTFERAKTRTSHL
jgi:hypothetical protein